MTSKLATSACRCTKINHTTLTRCFVRKSEDSNFHFSCQSEKQLRRSTAHAPQYTQFSLVISPLCCQTSPTLLRNHHYRSQPEPTAYKRHGVRLLSARGSSPELHARLFLRHCISHAESHTIGCANPPHAISTYDPDGFLPNLFTSHGQIQSLEVSRPAEPTPNHAEPSGQHQKCKI